MNTRITAVILAALLLQACATQKNLPTSEPDDAKFQARYEALRERYESGDVAAGIRDLRRSYVETANYTPYGGATNSALRAIATQANSGDFKGCFNSVKKAEPIAFPTLELHHFGWMCAGEAGELEASLRHERLARAIFADIIAAGDGKSIATAWQTISTDELYLVLAIQGLQPKAQALVHDGGRAFDLITVQPKEGGEEEKRYFDITLQMQYGMDFLRDAKK